jgi:hypothetical protein
VLDFLLLIAIIVITIKNFRLKISECNGAAKSTAAPGGKTPRYATEWNLISDMAASPWGSHWADVQEF